jgi:hypothetical protein
VNYSNRFDQKERRAQLAHDKAVADTRNTLAGRRLLDGLLENQGRFAKPQQKGPNPEYPKGADWSRDPVPDEPPLGYSINDVPVGGERHEERSVSASVSPKSGTDDKGEANDPSTSSLGGVDRASPVPTMRPVHFED